MSRPARATERFDARGGLCCSVQEPLAPFLVSRQPPGGRHRRIAFFVDPPDRTCTQSLLLTQAFFIQLGQFLPNGPQVSKEPQAIRSERWKVLRDLKIL